MAFKVGKRVVAESESIDRQPRSGVVEEVLRGAIGRGGLIDGGRGAEIASFGVVEFGIGRDRFVLGVGGAGRRCSSAGSWLLMGSGRAAGG